MKVRICALLLFCSVLQAQTVLEELLPYIPQQAEVIDFNHWENVWQQLAPDGSRADKLEAYRNAFVENRVYMTVTPFNRGDAHADTWGWDHTNLRWEAHLWWFDEATGEEFPFYIVAFSEATALEALTELFLERDFSQEPLKGAELYHFPFEEDADWQANTDFSLYNTAIVKDNLILILSYSADAVERVLAVKAGESKPLAKPIQAALRSLKPEASWLRASFSPRVCNTLRLSYFAEDLTAAGEWLLNASLHDYEGLVVSYSLEEDEVTGGFHFFYKDKTNAKRDEGTRARLVEESSGLGVLTESLPLELLNSEVQSTRLSLYVRQQVGLVQPFSGVALYPPPALTLCP